MRHYLSRGVGGVNTIVIAQPVRERGPVPGAELLATFEETIAQAISTLDSFDSSRFLDPTDEPDYVPTQFDLIFNIRFIWRRIQARSST
jgi:hypothetical protein